MWEGGGGGGGVEGEAFFLPLSHTHHTQMAQFLPQNPLLKHTVNLNCYSKLERWLDILLVI